MAISSISSDLTISPHTIPIEQIKQPSSLKTFSPLKTVAYRGKTYAISLWNQDARGQRTALVLQDQAAIEKVNELVKELLKAHENKSIAAKDLSDPTKMTAQGLHFKNKADPISHDFTIQDPELAKQMASQLSTPSKTWTAATVKAQDAWNALEHIVHTHSALVEPSPAQLKNRTSPKTNSPKPIDTDLSSPKTAQHSPASPETHKRKEKVDPSSPKAAIRTGPITSAELDLREEHIDMNQSGWFDRIHSPYLKRRILENVLRGQRPQGSPADKLYRKFCDESDYPLTTITELLQPIITQIDRLEQSKHSQIPHKIRQKAQNIYNFYCLPKDTPFYTFQLQKKIDAFLRENFDRTELYRYFREQAIAEGEAAETVTEAWNQTHLTENTDRFVQSLIRWIDNH